ncbi:MAG TPA: TolC family protein, partial [Humisphaera sp.]
MSTPRLLVLLMVAALAVTALFGTGCVLAPKEAEQEKAKMLAEGRRYEVPPERRELPELPDRPDWPQVLRRAFLANGDLEAAYFEWAAAVARIEQAGSYPNTPVALNFSYMFSAERMKSFDRLTTSVGPDPMESLALPPKVYQAAKVATADARAAGARFAAAKFDLQRKVLVAWADYALAAERARVARENLSLLTLIRDTAAGRVRAGGPQQDMLRADVELARAQDELRTMESDLPRMRAMLNAMAGRPPDAPLEPPDAMPAARPLAADDATLLARAAESSPDLAALARRVEGRADALELARLQYLPDINPTAMFTGGVSQAVGIGLSLPGLMPRVRGMVAEARADLRAAEAMRRQTR